MIPEPWAFTASRIVDAGLWCVIETHDGAGWEPRLAILRRDVGGILAAVADWSAPGAGAARIAGYTRDRLRRDDSAPTAAVRA